MPLELDSDQEKIALLLSNLPGMEYAAFFIVGGVINVVVLLLFALWFKREWRRTRK